MMSAIKLVVSENGKLIETVTKETNTQTTQIIKSLEVFQRSANDALTKLIEQHGEGDSGNLDNEENNDDEDDPDEQVSPRKKKK